jgi:hypothetical protein
MNAGEETAEEQTDSMRDDSSSCAPDGDALSKLMAMRSPVDDCPMCVAKEDDMNVRLVYPRLDSQTFEEIVATMKTVGVDPEKLIAEQDPDMVSRAVEYGCELKHIRLAIEYVNAKIFNDKMYKRNRRFERDSPVRVTQSWIKEWLLRHPNEIDEINWQSHTEESRHAHFKDLAVDYEVFQRYMAFYKRWGDEDSYQRMTTTVHDMGITTRETCVCAQCEYRMLATNKICPFCRRHVPEFAGGKDVAPESMSGSTRIIQRLAKSMITDRSRPGFSFPYRGVHSSGWHQTKILLKYDTSWREERTWKYNSVNPGQAFTSLMDRIRKDPVFRMNLTMQGGWSEETYHILIGLIQVAKEEKRWNQLFGGIPYEQRVQFYHQRDQWYRASGRDQLPVPEYPGADENQTRNALRLGKREFCGCSIHNAYNRPYARSTIS